MDTPQQETGDFAIALSSELISQVMEEYFNNHMFKMAVKVVDLEAKGDSYRFNLAFVVDDTTPTHRLTIDNNNNGTFEPISLEEKMKVHQWGIDTGLNNDHPAMQETGHRLYKQETAKEDTRLQEMLESVGKHTTTTKPSKVRKA